jgi:DNA-binding response OmpR family regulator
MGYHILLIEDDFYISSAVQSYLQCRNCTVHIAPSLEEAKVCLGKQVYSLLAVDWNLPDGTGEELCRWVRVKWPELPFLFLTVRGDTKDMVHGFSIGADDYITKPFELEVLYSRICAVLRRTGDISSHLLICGPITLDKNRLQVFCGKEEIVLSAMEYQLLFLLMENKNHILTRGRLLEQIWDSNGNFVNDNTLTVTMKRLREKLHNPSCLKTIRSLGYRLEEELC